MKLGPYEEDYITSMQGYSEENMHDFARAAVLADWRSVRLLRRIRKPANAAAAKWPGRFFIESTLVGVPDDIGGCVTVSPGGPGKLVPMHEVRGMWVERDRFREKANELHPFALVLKRRASRLALWAGKPSAFSEIEGFPSAVLAHHYPTVRNYGDMSRFATGPMNCLPMLTLSLAARHAKRFPSLALRDCSMPEEISP